MKKVPNEYKIALPTPSFLPAIGGAEVGLHNIAKTLKAKGHEPYVITSFTHAMSLRQMMVQIPYTVLYYPPKLLDIWIIEWLRKSIDPSISLLSPKAL